MTNTNELTAKAASTIGILENIAGYEPGDIDGDTVELRFEDECGCDTGCDVSLVEQCQNAADVIRALTEALEAAEKDAKQWKEVVAAFCADDADWHKLTTSNNELISQLSIALCKQADRIAELEARTLTVKLPQRYSMLHRLDFDEPYHTEMVYKQSDVLEALSVAGIKLQIEGE